VVHDVGVLRQELAADEDRPAAQAGVDEEAPVVVGAAGGGRVRRVGAGHRQRLEPLARAQRRRRRAGERRVAGMGGRGRARLRGRRGVTTTPGDEQNDHRNHEKTRRPKRHPPTVRRSTTPDQRPAPTARALRVVAADHAGGLGSPVRFGRSIMGHA
jgi:hypothetical protein